MLIQISLMTTYLCFFLQVKDVDFLKFTFLIEFPSDWIQSAQEDLHTRRKKKVALFACSEA